MLAHLGTGSAQIRPGATCARSLLRVGGRRRLLSELR